MMGERGNSKKSLIFDETRGVSGASTTATVSVSLRTWALATAFALVAYLAVFWLPFYFPPKQLLVSPSYAFGFNNSVAVLAMAALLGVATLHYLFLSRPRARDPLVSFPEDGASAPRSWAWLFVAMAGVYTVLTGVMYAYTRGAATASLTWESRPFLHRIKLVEAYGLRPYAEVQSDYGPALMYPPIYLHRLLAPLGVTVQGAYFLCHLMMNVAGLWCLWYLLRHVAAPARAKAAVFIVVGIAGFAPYMGLNGVVLRYVCPFAALLLGHRVWIALRVAPPPPRWVTLSFIIAALAVVNVLLSPEVAVAFVLGWLAYAVLWTRTDRRLLVVSLPTLAGTAVGCYFLLPPEYYGFLLRFSQGAHNLPMVPAAHLVLYLVTLALIVPPLLAAGWRGGRSDAALLGSLGVLSVVMMPGALGRCDPPHVLFYGLVVSMLLMIRLANCSLRAYGAYMLAYAGVFIGMMQLANLGYFFGLSTRDLLTHPAPAIRRFIDEQRAEFAPRDYRYLAALDKYPAIGLPFATYSGDNAAEDYLFANRKVDPEYYVGAVGVSTEAEISRKLAETARHEYLLVKKGWEKLPNARSDGSYLGGLRTWFIYPVRLEWKRPDLDHHGEIDRFIVEHYRAIEEVGPSVVVRRTDGLADRTEGISRP
jgi:hypothetical protein